MEILVIILSAFFSFIFGGLFFRLRNQENIFARQRILTYIDQNFQIYRGWLKNQNGNQRFCLHSFDNGLNWYAVAKTNPSGGFKVMGSADDIYPGLLEAIVQIKPDNQIWHFQKCSQPLIEHVELDDLEKVKIVFFDC